MRTIKYHLRKGGLKYSRFFNFVKSAEKVC
nr:MAG TPA: hypothetical protein [Bacteriophage sp.]